MLGLSFDTFEEDGRFGLITTRNGYDPTSDDLGRSNSPTITRFFSAEGRAYYIQAEISREREKLLAWKYERLISSLRKIVKRRSIRKAIGELLCPKP